MLRFLIRILKYVIEYNISMSLKKIVGSTVDVMTLSYTEKHLKEALGQEHGIPTTILTVIAEKSHNQYNIKSIVAFFDKAFKIDLREWKKYRNLLSILDYLLKFGSSDMVTSIRKYQSDLRMLQNYTLTENGVDRGAQIRESAALICTLLSNFKELDEVREQSRKHREKFIGFSSNTYENPQKSNSYGSDFQNISSISYSSGSLTYNPVSFSVPQGSNYGNRLSQDSRIEENKKNTNNLLVQEDRGCRTSGKESSDYSQSERNKMYFPQERVGADSSNNEKPKVADIFTLSSQTTHERPLPGHYLVTSERNIEEIKPPEFFSKIVRSENIEHRNPHTATEKVYLKESPRLRVPAEENARNMKELDRTTGGGKIYKDIFSTNDTTQKTLGVHYDIFESHDKKSDSEISKLYPESQDIDMYHIDKSVQEKVVKFHLESHQSLTEDILQINNKTPGSNIFAGMVQRRKQELIEEAIPFPKSVVKPAEQKGSWNLDFLDIKITPQALPNPPQSNPEISVSIKKVLPKIKSNLIETKPLSLPKAKPKLSPEDLEKKLLGLDFT